MDIMEKKRLKYVQSLVSLQPVEEFWERYVLIEGNKNRQQTTYSNLNYSPDAAVLKFKPSVGPVFETQIVSPSGRVSVVLNC